MNDWNAGYTTDLNYTYGYYRELSPTLLDFAALSKWRKGAPLAGPTTYCELGSGWGLTSNILAAANPEIEFYATDFNPAQVAGARALAAEAGLPNVHFSDASFQEYLHDESLPDFDFISLHGIYSWISPENRQAIIDFIKKKLKVGGLVYLSYNALPGWSQAAPLRRLLSELGAANPGSLPVRVDRALAYAERLKDAGIALFGSTYGLPQRFEKLLAMNRTYIAHEYFNEHWNPMYFGDVARDLSAAKLSFVGSASLLDHIDPVNLKPDHKALLDELTDPIQHETLRDFFTMTQFRRDIFSRGALELSSGEAQARWLDLRLALLVPREGVPLAVKGPLGEARLQEETYNPILDGLKDGPKTLKDLLAEPAVGALGDARVTEAIKVLIGMGNLEPCLPEKGQAERAKRTRAFNTAIMKRARWSSPISFLASPVTGGGVPADRFNQLFLLALQEKHSDVPVEVWKQMASQNQKLMKEGKALESAEDNLAELKERYQTFKDNALPVYRRLGIA